MRPRSTFAIPRERRSLFDSRQLARLRLDFHQQCHRCVKPSTVARHYTVGKTSAQLMCVHHVQAPDIIGPTAGGALPAQRGYDGSSEIDGVRLQHGPTLIERNIERNYHY